MIRGMADEESGTEENGTTEEAAPIASQGKPPSPAIASLTPDAVRKSPEYQVQKEAARTAARAQGAAEAEANRLRTELETLRAAAEAQARESQLAGVRSVLGDQGEVLYNEIAELSNTDPVAAATKIRELGAMLAQNQPPVVPGSGTQPPPAGGAHVPQAPFPPSGVSASAPLGQPTTDNSYDQIATEAEKRYQDVVAIVQGPLSGRNRVTGKMRTGAIMDFLVSSVAKAVSRRQAEGRR